MWGAVLKGHSVGRVRTTGLWSKKEPSSYSGQQKFTSWHHVSYGDCEITVAAVTDGTILMGSLLWRPWWGIHTTCFLLTLEGDSALGHSRLLGDFYCHTALTLCPMYIYVFFYVQTSCSYTNTVQTNLGPPHMFLLSLNHLIDCFQIESHSEVLQVRPSRWAWRTNVNSRTLSVLFLQNSKLLFVSTTAS